MTERRPPRSTRPAVGVWCGSALGFVAVLAVLSWQVAAGRDPAIGAGTQTAAATPVHRVVVRRIVRRVIVTERAPRRGQPASAPVEDSPPPAPAAPAPEDPAPAPVAPAPAPPTTRAS
jgi:hypothetical protein